ncbi:MAG: endonuclease/exonuclease/phosphatase family protein [Bacteroidota bacterium]
MIKRFLFGLFFLLYLPVILISLLAVGAPFISTEWLPAVQFLPLGAQYFAPLHFLILLILSNSYWKTRLVALVCFLACAYILMKEYRMDLSAEEGPADVKMLSYNVQSFRYTPDQYIDSIGSLVAKLDPDIVCFQEFFNGPLKDKNQLALEALSQLSGLPNDTIVTGNGNVGGAILSKYPILAVERLFFTAKTANYGFWVKLQTPQGPLGVYNVHLASFQFESKVPESGKWKPFLKTVYQKAASIIPEQKEQADLILAHADKHSIPFILAGDLNSLPHSYIVSLFSTKYEDSFMKAGSGYGATFEIWGPLGMRIDYLFVSPTMKTLSHEVISADISDHFPIMGEFIFSEEQ